jgi:hypothetical protein
VNNSPSLEAIKNKAFKILTGAPLDSPHQVIYLCIYDHWLTESEYISTPMYFQDFQEKGREDDYINYENNFLSFFETLYSDNIFTLDWDTPAQPIINPQKLCKEVKHALRTENSLCFIIPNNNTVIISNHDMTWPVYLFPPYSKYVEIAARTSGLYCLY